MFAAVHGPRPLSLFAPSRLAALINEVLWAWWGDAVAPDLVLAPPLVKPKTCRAPCHFPCALTCPKTRRGLGPLGPSPPGGLGLPPKAGA